MIHKTLQNNLQFSFGSVASLLIHYESGRSDKSKYEYILKNMPICLTQILAEKSSVNSK